MATAVQGAGQDAFDSFDHIRGGPGRQPANNKKLKITKKTF
jgi:hypothetical protein